MLPGRTGSTPGMGRDASGTHQIIDYFGIELTCHRKIHYLVYIEFLVGVAFCPNFKMANSNLLASVTNENEQSGYQLVCVSPSGVKC